MGDLGKLLIVFGLLIAAVGVVLVLVGRLPGDVYVQRGSWTFYFPLATSIIVSLVLTLLFWLIRRR